MTFHLIKNLEIWKFSKLTTSWFILSKIGISKYCIDMHYLIMHPRHFQGFYNSTMICLVTISPWNLLACVKSYRFLCHSQKSAHITCNPNAFIALSFEYKQEQSWFIFCIRWLSFGWMGVKILGAIMLNMETFVLYT